MESLQNHFLIAMPSLDDSFFERAVIYICEHDAKGAMGLVINKPIGIDVASLLEQMDLPAAQINADFAVNAQVLMGGPVAQDRGFVLHSSQANWTNSRELGNGLMLTTSRDILTALGSDKAPAQFLVALGYAGWSPQQLEQELADNSWLTIPANHQLLFDVKHDERWPQASRALGFDAWQLSSQVGHA
ncbi:MAG: YqgE/AlgH family protein [Shewanella sp.]